MNTPIVQGELIIVHEQIKEIIYVIMYDNTKWQDFIYSRVGGIVLPLHEYSVCWHHTHIYLYRYWHKLFSKIGATRRLVKAFVQTSWNNTCTLKYNLKNRKDLKVFIDHRPEVISQEQAECLFTQRRRNLGRNRSNGQYMCGYLENFTGHIYTTLVFIIRGRRG